MDVLLIFTFLFYVHFVSCTSGYDSVLRLFHSDPDRSTKAYERFALGCLTAKRLENSTGGSMFAPMLKSFSEANETSKENEYKKLMNGLDDYYKNNLLKLILKMKSGRMVTTEADIIVNSIRLVVEEEDYFEDYSLDTFEYSPRTLELMFSTLKGIDQNFTGYSKDDEDDDEDSNSEIAVFAAEFAKYCKTDLQLAEPLAFILKILAKESCEIPFVKFNRNLDQSREFDNFIKVCKAKHLNCPQDSIILAKSIVYGPVTTTSTNTFYSLGLGAIIEDICEIEEDRNQLIRRIIESNSYDRFCGYFEGSQSELVAELKTEIEEQEANLNAILKFLAFHPNEAEDHCEILELFSEKSNAFKEFSHIDKTFVERQIIGIDAKIASLIRYTEAQSEETLFNYSLILIMKYYNLFPMMKLSSNNLPSNNLERVLDLMLHPLALSKGLVKEYGPLLKRVIELPYIIFNCDFLRKFYILTTSVYDVNEATELTNSLAIIAIFSPKRDDAFELFKEVYKFHQSEQLPSDILAKASIVKALSRHNDLLVKQIIYFAKEHGILSKTFILLCNEITRILNTPHSRKLVKKFNKLDL